MLSKAIIYLPHLLPNLNAQDQAKLNQHSRICEEINRLTEKGLDADRAKLSQLLQMLSQIKASFSNEIIQHLEKKMGL